MATPNYGYEKRQRELAKKQKKEEKLRAKAGRKPTGDDALDGQGSSEDVTPGSGPSGTTGQTPSN